MISKDEVEMDQQKVESIKAWPIPKSVKELRGFLCLVGYYGRFIKGYGMISRPLINLLKKNNFRWNDESTMAFEQLKTAMSSAPLLTLPNFDEEFTIETDANNQGIGVILSQAERLVAFMSKSLYEKNQTLSTYEKEMSAVVLAVQKWRLYVLGRHLKIKTDHQSLKYLLQQRINTPNQQRWIAKLMGYDFKIIYKKGSKNTVVDALSREFNLSTMSMVNSELWEKVTHS